MASSSADHSYTPRDHKLVPSAARSVAHSALPPLPAFQKRDARGNLPVTLVLFYQYIEPPWTVAEHKEALKFVIGLGKEHGICGRGRCAQEGLNCSLTGSAKGIRAFCEGLRKWNPVFLETDFKLTDGVPHAHRFKALTINKREELVAYGLAGTKAPALSSSRAQVRARAPARPATPLPPLPPPATTRAPLPPAATTRAPRLPRSTSRLTSTWLP
jgi:hypothetical protein